MNIHLIDSLNLISKTQKTKLKTKIKEQIEQNNNIQTILDMIHYNGDIKYNSVKMINTDNDYFITFEIVENERELLRKKLRQKLKSQGRTVDPRWTMYQNMKKRGAKLANGDNIPDPDFISKNKEMFVSQMNLFEETMKDDDNPFIKYIKLCLSHI